MKAEDSLVRLDRFKAECKAQGVELTPSSLVSRLWRSPSFWSDLLAGRKSFGEKLARAIEEQMQISRYSLDRALSASPVPRSFADLNGFEGQLVTLFRQLTPDEQHDALIALNKAIQGTYRKPKQD